jgi:sulfite exporter TauE/SafE
MCGPLACSWAVSSGGGQRRFIQSSALYHTMRLLSYTLVGAIAGAIGAAPLKYFQSGAGVVLPWLLVVAFAVFGLGLDAWLPKPGFLSKPGAALLGAATPLLPCGPLYVMFALAMTGGSAVRGSEFTFAFGLGTLPLLWLAQTQLHWLGGKMSPVTMRRVQRGLALAAALIMAWRLRATLGIGDIEQGCGCHGV